LQCCAPKARSDERNGRSVRLIYLVGFASQNNGSDSPKTPTQLKPSAARGGTQAACAERVDKLVERRLLCHMAAFYDAGRVCAAFWEISALDMQRMGPMLKPRPPLDPDCADEVVHANTLTSYNMEHLITYLRLLDAEADEAEWTEVARIVLHVDPESEPDRARRAWENHLVRARWMTEHGYRHLLRADNAPRDLCRPTRPSVPAKSSPGRPSGMGHGLPCPPPTPRRPQFAPAPERES
jgi:hypothetical protein